MKLFNVCANKLSLSGIYVKVNRRRPQCRRHEGLRGLCLSKLQAPPNRNMKHYKSVEFLSNFDMSRPPTQTEIPEEDFLPTVLT